MRQITLIPLVVACSLFMEHLDSTVIATSLPAIAHSLKESPVRLNLGLTSYLFSLAVFIPISGWVADRFGARSVFRVAIGIFIVGSVMCGFTNSLWGFVAARIIQGMGGSMMMPVGRLVLLRAVPKAELVNAMTMVAMPALVGPIVGPPLGGFITTYFSWRWIFWINVPIGIAGIVLATLFFENTREERAVRLDARGFLLTALGFTGLIFGFETVGRDTLPPAASLALMAAGAISLAAYVRYARTVRNPILDVTLLLLPTFRASVAGGFLFRIGIGALPFLLPMLFQEGFGLNPLNSGLLTFTAAVGALAMKFTARPILRWLGFRPVLLWNALMSGAVIAANSLFRADTPDLAIIAVLLVGGFFRSLQFTCIGTIAYAEVPRERMSQATSFAGIAQQLSLSVGVGTGALVLHLTTGLHGHHALAASDFIPAFLAVGAIAASSAALFAMLPAHAGDELTGVSAKPPADHPSPPPAPSDGGPS